VFGLDFLHCWNGLPALFEKITYMVGLDYLHGGTGLPK
jgi:hypothetical protein